MNIVIALSRFSVGESSISCGCGAGGDMGIARIYKSLCMDMRKSEIGPNLSKKALLTGRRAAILENESSCTRCPVCLGPLPEGKKICSPRCRLVKWAGRTLLEAYREGRADGLRAIIEEIKRHEG
jgi:hypothetical protein